MNIVKNLVTFTVFFRWVENIKAAERAILLMPQIVEYCTAARSKKVTCPTNQSFTVIQKAIQDPLITAQLQFFLMIAREVEPFLRRYQTDKPMLPFIGKDLGLLVKVLMEKIVKPEVLAEKATSLSSMVKIDITDKTNWLELNNIEVGFVAERLLRSNNASNRQKSDFRFGCRHFLEATIKKLLEKSPITYPLVRLLSWMDPRQIAKSDEREFNLKKMKRTLHIMVEAKRVQESVCDHIITEFSRLLDHLHSDAETRAMFSDFNPDKDGDRVDTLFHSVLSSDKQYADLWAVLRQLLLLSHGQATVERGFSINKELTVENLAKESLVARRQIVQGVKKAGGVHCVPITKELLLSASSARSRYQQHLEDAKQADAAAKRGEKRKDLENNIKELETKKARIEKDIQHLQAKADKLSEDAEAKGDLTLLTEANALRKKAKDKRASLPALQKDIDSELANLKESH